MMVELLLAEIRQTAGLTQEQLAASLGVDSSRLSELEPQQDFPISTLQELVRAFCAEVGSRE